MLTRRESKQIVNFIKLEIKKGKTAFLTDGVIDLSKRIVGFLSANRVNITDSGSYYNSSTVEGALQEIYASGIVQSINDLYDDITISGAGGCSVSEDGQIIVISGAAVAGDWLGLTDTPSSYSGKATQYVAVNDNEDGLEFTADIPSGTFIGLSDTPNDYTGQQYKYFRVNDTEDGMEFTSAVGSGVSAVNEITGDVTISGAGSVTISESGQIITVSGAAGGNGSSTWLGLTETPSSFSDYAGYVSVVNDAEDALEFAAKASITIQDYTVYVDSSASGIADGTSWTDAFNTITSGWQSLPAVVAHDVIMKVRKGTNPYRETVTCDAKYIIGSITIEAEYYWYGDCESNVGGAGEITVSGAFADVVVGDKVFVIDLNGAEGRCQNYEYGVVDNISNIPDRIGTDLSVTPTTNWKYTVVGTEISGSDNGTDGGTARDYCFDLITIDNITIQGFYITFSDSWAIHTSGSRGLLIYANILENVDYGVVFGNHSVGYFRYGYVEADGAGCVGADADGQSKLDFRYSVIGSVTAGQRALYAVYESSIVLYYSYVDSAGRGIDCARLSYGLALRSTISSNVTIGLYVRMNSAIEVAYLTNSASTPEDPVGTSEGAYIS